MFSSDSRFLGTISGENTAKLWNTETGELTTTLKGHGSEVLWMTFSPDNRIMATTSKDGTARLWETRTGNSLHVITLSDDEEFLYTTAFSPDGKSLATTLEDGTVRLWNVQTGKHIRNLSGHKRGVLRMDFSPDGRRLLAISEKDVRLWDVE